MQYSLKPATVSHLLNRFGSDISEIFALIEDDRKLAQPIINNLPYLKAEIVYAVVAEGALSLSDVMERRTRIAFEAPNFGLNHVVAIADLIAPYLGWKASEKKASVTQYQDAMARASQAVKNLN